MNLYRNKADEGEIGAHLLGCNFDPPLEKYVDNLSEYVEKIVSKAERFEAWANGRLIGFLACYANDYESKEAFITMISVLPEGRGKGLATQLISLAEDYCKNEGFALISLDVREENTGALRLYEREGYVFNFKKNKSLRLSKSLV